MSLVLNNSLRNYIQAFRHYSPISTSNLIYRFANKNDFESLSKLATEQYILEDEHYKGLGGSAEEAAVQVEWMVRKSLKSHYSMVATDNKMTYAFSLIQVRHRDSKLNRWSEMEKRPDRTANFSLLWDVCDMAEKEFWNREADLKKIALVEAVYVAPEVRRHGVGKTMLKTQMDLLRDSEKNKKDDKLGGVMAVATSFANKKQFVKQGFTELFTLSSEVYRRPNGESWKSADPELPYASVVFKKL